jgi:hypothetical protein
MEIFVDPITYVITSAGSPVHCNVVAPPRYKLGGKWYCSYPGLREYHDPAMLPVDDVQIETLRMNDIWLGKSIYMKKQLVEFVVFQDSKGTRRAYLAETVEVAYCRRNNREEWWLTLEARAQSSRINIIMMSLIPLYEVIGPFIFFMSLLLMVWGGLRLIVTIFLRMAIIMRYREYGVWILAAF